MEMDILAIPQEKPLIEKKAVFLLSGGMDSTTLFAEVLKDGWELFPVIFNYGQKHRKSENAAALAISKYYSEKYPGKVAPAKIIELDLSKITSSTLISEDMNIPNNMEEQAKTVVPHRNMMMCTIASSYGISVEAYNIFITPVLDDRQNYPDCRQEFINDLKSALSKSADRTINVLAPYINKPKSEIIAWGLKNNVPYELTWSCYNGGTYIRNLNKGRDVLVPCCVKDSRIYELNSFDGTMKEAFIKKLHKNPAGCPACRERLGSFQANGAIDPLISNLY